MNSDAPRPVTIVTGGSSGIGRATALRFARRGDTVVIVDVEVVGGAQTEALIRAEGHEHVTFISADVSDDSHAAAVVDRVVLQFGRLDYAFNNAGISGRVAPLADHELSHYEEVMAVNARGVFLGMKHQIPAMIASGGGSIVNTASLAGTQAFAGNGVYVASKHAIIGLTKNAALDYAVRGVRVNAVSPGVTDTAMTQVFDRQSVAAIAARVPLGRMGQPDDVAAAVMWLCSEESSYVTGTQIVVDGGMSIGR